MADGKRHEPLDRVRALGPRVSVHQQEVTAGGEARALVQCGAVPEVDVELDELHLGEAIADDRSGPVGGSAVDEDHLSTAAGHPAEHLLDVRPGIPRGDDDREAGGLHDRSTLPVEESRLFAEALRTRPLSPPTLAGSFSRSLWCERMAAGIRSSLGPGR